MKTQFNKVMQAAVAAAALTFATASYASPDVYSSTKLLEENIEVNAAGSKYFKDVEFAGSLYIGVQVYEMFNANNATQRYVAYCIQPDVDVQPGATYTASYNFTPSADVRKLYESSFASTVGNAEKQKAFQLALWELQNDDNNLSYVDANSKQYFAAGQSPTVDMAAAMLVSASNYTLGVNHYSYVTFEGNANGVESQQLLGVREVTAVPEADTWAMMAVGLGLVGLVGRRKQKNEKFA